MKCIIGAEDYALSQKNDYVPVVYDTAVLNNGHVMLCGTSGTGKSFTLQRMVESALGSKNTRVHLFDIHSEYSFSGGVAAEFGESSSFGYNPLLVDPSPKNGGVRRAISSFISIINDSGTKLGSRQEPAMKNLLEELYIAHGFDADDPSSWKKKSLNEAQWYELHKKGKSRFGYQPTLMDLMLIVEAKIVHVFTGGNSLAARALSKVNTKARKLAKYKKEMVRKDSLNVDEREKLGADLEAAKAEAIDAYASYIEKIENGSEFWDLIKYNSVDTLVAIKERLTAISHTGIFAPNPPPFRDSRLCVYKLKDLRHEEASMLIQLRMLDILEEQKQLGPTADVRVVIILEEAHLFVAEVSEDHPVMIIANQARKFGVALWLISQQPSHFPTDFRNNVSTTIFLGVHSSSHAEVEKKFNIAKDQLKHLKPQNTALVRLGIKGQGEGMFKSVCVSASRLKGAKIKAAPERKSA